MPSARISLTACSALALVVGCIHIRGQVSAGSYRDLNPGATFVVLDSDSITLTERHIQDLIRGQLVSLGFKEAESLGHADLAVVYSYSVGAGQTVVSSNPDFVWGGQKVSSTTTYPRYFQVSVLDVTASQDSEEPVVAWQAEIYSQGSSQNMSWLAEHFVPELFKYFGQSTTNERFFKSVPLQ